MKKIYYILIILLISKLSYTQSIDGGLEDPETGIGIACPGSTVNYSISNGKPNTVYRWKITKGAIANSITCNTQNVNITWDTDLTTNGKIEIFKARGGCSSTDDSLVYTYNVRRPEYPTLGNNSSPSPIQCGTQQALTAVFSFNLEEGDYTYINNWTFNNTSEYIELPTGWVVSNIVTSNRSFAGTTYRDYTLTIIPDGIHDGNVRARIKSFCTPSYYNNWSIIKNFRFAAATISSSDNGRIICQNSAETFTVTTSSSATTYTWTAPAGYLINGSLSTLTTTSNSISLTNNSAADGSSGILTVYATNCAGNSNSLNLVVYSGKPSVSTSLTGSVCVNEPGIIRIISTPGSSVQSITALVSGGINQPLTELYSSHYEVPGDALWVDITVSNKCGSTSIRRRLMRMNCSYSSSVNEKYKIYPNPSDTELMLDLQNDLQNIYLSARLYNGEGKEVRTLNSLEDKSINRMVIKDLKAGLYFLHLITKDGKIEKRQILIQH